MSLLCTMAWQMRAMALAFAQPDVVEQLERAVAPLRPAHSRFGER